MDADAVFALIIVGIVIFGTILRLVREIPESIWNWSNGSVVAAAITTAVFIYVFNKRIRR